MYLVWIVAPYIILACSMYLGKVGKPAWVVRKFIHIFGLSYASLMIGLNSFEDAFIIAVIFCVSFVIVSFSGFIPMYQFLVEKGTRAGESPLMSYLNSASTVVIGLILMLLLQEHKWIFMASLFSLAIGDGLAEVVGRKFGRIHYKVFSKKTVEGSFMVFLGTVIGISLSASLYQISTEGMLPLFLLISLGVMVIEAFSIVFLDNILIPAFVSTMLFFFAGGL